MCVIVWRPPDWLVEITAPYASYLDVKGRREGKGSEVKERIGEAGRK